MTFKEALATLPQYILPHHFLSSMMRKVSRSENTFIKTLFITQIIKHYGVNMAESMIEDIRAFKSFNHFFTRELKPGLRPVTNEPNAIASPADGAISQAGAITDGNIFQAKGKSFTATDLLGGSAERAAPFNNGVFSTIYLAPKDYHRMHMPTTGTLREMVHVPGRLFSVNTVTANNVPGLFARNERVVAIFDTAAGPMALVMVGAIFVCSIETVWHGEVTPPSATSVQTWQYNDKPVTLNIGEELGRFNMGSTIIVLFGKDAAQWREGLIAGEVVKLGEKIGQYY
ncbi:Phosphatidylserine decarboxylase proenzyme [Crenothrix polyspora]|uniref:Phosphatidylserine decarboxylase proenzyme n=1 Tax=Crenothrix polyspora TaxID=360316 RepID=A0A1R4H7H5_9GAMM|nr:archaetidylserine decarboxylase [Crenothrix polyspora]SJM91981.1 Phosphatidylserine decarboxylase proenzyme [Crenothrix polyspora]